MTMWHSVAQHRCLSLIPSVSCVQLTSLHANRRYTLWYQNYPYACDSVTEWNIGMFCLLCLCTLRFDVGKYMFGRWKLLRRRRIQPEKWTATLQTREQHNILEWWYVLLCCLVFPTRECGTRECGTRECRCEKWQDVHLHLSACMYVCTASTVVEGSIKWTPDCVYVEGQVITTNFMNTQVLDPPSPLDIIHV